MNLRGSRHESYNSPPLETVLLKSPGLEGAVYIFFMIQMRCPVDGLIHPIRYSFLFCDECLDFFLKII